MGFDAYVFDLDGTLLNTLPDLVFLTNRVLHEHGFPEHTTEEINSYVGGGARVLLRRATPKGTPDAEIDAILSRWKELYPEFGHRLTVPYEGMPEALAVLKGRGAKLGVLSNKFDAAVRSVIAEHFPGVFDIARGECAEIPRKPDPTGLRYLLDQLGVSPERTAYVGDSGIDVETAVAVGAYPIGVTWGYRKPEELLEKGAALLVDHPSALPSARRA